MFTISRTRLLAGAATLALTASLGTSPGLAQETADATMQVTALVAQSCTVNSDGDLNFPTPVSTESSVANSSFTVDCTTEGNIQVEIDGGLNLNGEARRMSNDDGDLMPYNLHKVSTLNDSWEPNVKSTEAVTPGTTQFDVHGIVTNSNFTAAPAGDYSDTITMTVTF